MTIRLNDEVLVEHTFDASFAFARLCLPLRPRGGGIT